MEDLTGKQLGAYRIIAPIGEGGMAAVYKAYQPSMDRSVALKILPRDFARDPEFIARFQREARVIGQLEHAHILPVYDYGESDGYTYLVMRLVSGGDLTGLLAKRTPTLAEVSRYISEIASALDYAHAKGVIHRDIKPSNVLIDDQGGCLLSDFGLAKMMISDARFTASGAFIGTPTYASPEQCMGYELDARTDIYSLGVMLYEMCTGRPPFRGETPMGIVLKHINDPLPLPRSIDPALPEPVERVILKALAKNRDERYQSAGALAEALRKAVAGARSGAGARASAGALAAAGRAGLPEPVGMDVSAPDGGLASARGGFLASTAGTTPVGTPELVRDTTLPPPNPGPFRRYLPVIAILVVVVALGIIGLLSLKPKQATIPPAATALSSAVRASEPAAQEVTQVAGVENTAAPATQAVEAPTPTEAQAVPSEPPAAPISSGNWLALGDLPRSVNSFVLDPDDPKVIYAASGDYTGSGAGIYKSADAGVTWQKISQNLPNNRILTLAVVRQGGQRIFLASGDFGVYASSDEGVTWAETSNPGSMASEPWQMIVAQDGLTVYAIMQSHGLARSQNGGQTWEPLNSGLPVHNSDMIYLGALAIDPANPQVLYAGMGQFSGQGEGVYKSTDGGETWTPSNKGMLDYGISALAIDPKQPQVIYAGCETGELFKSSDGGQTWTNITARLANFQAGAGHLVRGIRIDPQAGTLYLLADYVALQTSSDGGETWELSSLMPGQQQPYYGAWNLLLGEKPGDKPVLFVALQSWGGSWRYSEAPVTVVPAGTPTLVPEAAPSTAKINGTWQAIADLPRQVNVFAIDPSEPKRILAATANGIYRSEDGGQTWQDSSNGLGTQKVTALAFSSGELPLVYATLDTGNTVYASQDGGQNWAARGNLTIYGSFESRLVTSPFDPNVVFFLSAEGSARSSDGAQTWLPFGEGLPKERDQVLLVTLAFDPADPNILYGGTGGFVGNGQGVYKSTDGGETWTPSNKGMLDYKISALAVDPRNPQVVYAGGYDGDLFKSSDGGQTWTNLKDRLALRQYGEPRTIRALVVDPANGLVYLLGDNSGLLYTNDGGAKWRMAGNPPGTDQPRYETLAVQPGEMPVFYMAIMDQGGAWRFGE